MPANASTAQRLMTMDAYRRAGFDVKAVLNEPSAAGFEYAHRFRETVTSKREYVLVYDLGGGTFDASLIHMEGKSNEVVTSSGVSRLGGDDFDEAIALLVLARRGGGSLTQQLLEEVRGQKESLGPNTPQVRGGRARCCRWTRCTPPACRWWSRPSPPWSRPCAIPRRAGDEEIAWSELAGIYVVGGGVGVPARLPAPARALRAHRVRRSPHPFGSMRHRPRHPPRRGTGLRAERAPPAALRRVPRGRGGERVSFDVLVPKDTPAARAGLAPLPRGAQRRAVTASSSAGASRAGGPRATSPPGTRCSSRSIPGCAAANLAGVPVQRLGHGPEVEETYRLRVRRDGHRQPARPRRRLRADAPAFPALNRAKDFPG